MGSVRYMPFSCVVGVGVLEMPVSSQGDQFKKNNQYEVEVFLKTIICTSSLLESLPVPYGNRV